MTSLNLDYPLPTNKWAKRMPYDDVPGYRKLGKKIELLTQLSLLPTIFTKALDMHKRGVQTDIASVAIDHLLYWHIASSDNDKPILKTKLPHQDKFAFMTRQQILELAEEVQIELGSSLA